MKISVMRPAAAIPLAIGGLILIALALLDAGPNEKADTAQASSPDSASAQP